GRRPFHPEPTRERRSYLTHPQRSGEGSAPLLLRKARGSLSSPVRTSAGKSSSPSGAIFQGPFPSSRAGIWPYLRQPIHRALVLNEQGSRFSSDAERGG